MVALSAPISKSHSGEQTTHWVAAPTTRGTFGLLVSCVLTLILCLWTSLHLNVPHQNEKPMKRVGRKLCWTLLALFTPELVVYIAWKQWISASALCKKVNKLLDKQGQSQRHWTMVHAFYAGMGGFVVEINDPEKPFIRNKPTPFRVTLTARGMSLLARCGYIPDIFEASITDKSKADSLAKLLVCVQAVWCLLQYTGRLIGHLPVTLLEVNTLGHALCALGIYMSWWYKPLDVKDPHVVSGEWVPRMCAYMWMRSLISARCLDHDQQRDREGRYFEPLDVTSSTGCQPAELHAGECISGTCFRLNEMLFELPPERKQRVWTSPFHYHFEQWEEVVSQKLPIHPEDIRRWTLATEAINQYDALKEDIRGRQYLPIREFLVTRVGDTHTDGLLTGDVSPTVFALVLAFVSAAYGGLHASGWNDFFPTWQECLMWRISATVVAGAGVTSSLIIVCEKRILEPIMNWIQARPRPWSDILMVSIIIAPLCLILFCYCCCRVFLVVEAFISIRELPIDAYKTPAWTQLLPHL